MRDFLESLLAGVVATGLALAFLRSLVWLAEVLR